MFKETDLNSLKYLLVSKSQNFKIFKLNLQLSWVVRGGG